MTPGGLRLSFTQMIEVNRRGDIALFMRGGGTATALVRDGRSTLIQSSDGSVDGVTFPFAGNLAIDEHGNVLFGGYISDGTKPYFGLWDGTAARIVMTPQTRMPDGSLVSNDAGDPKGCEDGLLIGTLGTVARYLGGTWDYVAPRTDRLASGLLANNLGVYDANRRCDVAFLANFGGDIEARTGGQFRQIQNLNQLTPDGDLLRVVQVLINDDATVYVLAANDSGEEVIYKATLLE